MTLRQHLLDLEEQFWKGDTPFYRKNLTDDAFMVFPDPPGVLTREQAVEAIGAAPRWTEIIFGDVRLVRLTDAAVVLTYRASARRAGKEGRYTALTSSAYVRQDDSWKLAFHQQTPSAGG